MLQLLITATTVYPRWTFILMTFFSLLCTVGWYFAVFDNNVMDLLTNMEATLASNSETKFFNHFNSSNYMIFSLSSGRNALDKDMLLAVWDIKHKLFELESKDSNDVTKFYKIDEFCIPLLNATMGTSCLYASPTMFWDSREALERDVDIIRTMSIFRKGFCQQILNTTSFFGKPEVLNGKLISADSISFRLYTQQSVLNTKYAPILEDLERQFDETVMEESRKYPQFQFTYQTSSTFTRTLNTSISQMQVNFILCILSFCIIPILFTPTNRKSSLFRRYSRKIMIGVLITINCILSIAAAVGICSVFGVGINPISVQVIPFFIFGMASDNAFLLLSVYDNAVVHDNAVADKTKTSLQVAGFALICGLCEIICLLLVILAMRMKFLHQLCSMLIVALVFNCAFQIFSLLPILNILSEDEKEAITDTPLSLSEGKDIDKMRKSLGKKVLSTFYSALTTNGYYRKGIIGFFLITTLIFAVLAKDSVVDINTMAIYGDSDILQEVPVYLVLNDLPINGLNSSSTFGISTTKFRSSIDWIESFRTWLWFTSYIKYENLDSFEYLKYLKIFLSDDYYGASCLNANFNQNVSRIIGYVESSIAGSMQEYYRNIKSAQDSLKALNIDGYFYWPIHRIASSMFDGLEEIFVLITIGGNIIVVVVNSFLNRNQAKQNLEFIVGMICTQILIFGMLAVSSIPLNPFTMTNVLLAIGVYADFNNCITASIKYRHLMVSSGDDKTKYVQSADCLIWSFFGSISGLLFLVFGPIKILRMYFLNVYAIIIMASLLTNLVLVPSLIK